MLNSSLRGCSAVGMFVGVVPLHSRLIRLPFQNRSGSWIQDLLHWVRHDLSTKHFHWFAIVSKCHHLVLALPAQVTEVKCCEWIVLNDVVWIELFEDLGQTPEKVLGGSYSF